ncbi:hypothetical protein SAMN02910340_00889 [Methanosarcina thermophila]|jgi:hypothetical protein|uniref:Uncharacterized protein n=1 Tax=Methanosarcina thermophila TaxID=2210 RepID=A0A1I6YI83_METTE|nr:hypothetical protein SAMN02910340_00889 [Methanosarcina thermophila]
MTSNIKMLLGIRLMNNLDKSSIIIKNIPVMKKLIEILNAIKLLNAAKIVFLRTLIEG